MLNRILIIEDDVDILNMLKTILTTNNYEVVGINKTDDILKDIKIYEPKLVLTDYLLNGLNGGRICKIIKSNPMFCKIPVILITAYSGLALLQANFGYDAFISKPFEIHELLAAIKKYI